MLLNSVLLVCVVAPLLLGLAGFWRRAQIGTNKITADATPFSVSLILGSALCCCLAFNITFFIQEVGLVLPKAFTPGLMPTLYHNNHLWQGEHPLAYLFQGTGALATFISGILSFSLVRSNRLQSVGSKLFFLWMAYHGVFMAVPQIVIGAINPYNDVGMAMDYFQLSGGSKAILALIALSAIPPLAMVLTRPFLSVASDNSAVDSRGNRTRFIAQVVTFPALIAIVLVIPYRVPREWLEVIILPLIVFFIGTVWIQASAWWIRNSDLSPHLAPVSLKKLGLAAVCLLLVFQIILRPGITVSMHEIAKKSEAIMYMVV